jgi:hypothetical protein
MKPTKLFAIVLLILAGISVAQAILVWFVPDSTSIQVIGTNVVFSTSFRTSPNKTYTVQIQYNDSTDSNSWMSTSNNIIGTGGTVTWSYTDFGAASLSQRFYRLRVALLSP